MEIGQISKSDMKYEWCRLQTFSNFSDNTPVSFCNLAKSGFYYTGFNDIVQCYFCGYVWRDWSNERLPIHCEESNQNISIHPEPTLMVPSGQPLSALPVGNIYQRTQTQRSNTPPSEKHKTDYSEFRNIVRLHTLKSNWNTSSDSQTSRKNQQQAVQNNAPELAVEVEGHATQSIQLSKQPKITSTLGRGPKQEKEKAKTCTTLTSTKPIKIQPPTQTRHSVVHHTAVSTESGAEGNHAHVDPGTNRNLQNGTPYPSIVPILNRQELPHISSRIRVTTGVPQMYMDRLATFRDLVQPLCQPSDVLAANGFYYVGIPGTVKCSYCGTVWHVTENIQNMNTAHTRDCKFQSEHVELGSIETPSLSSQTASLTDSDISSQPASLDAATFGFQTQDIVNAYRERASNSLDCRVIYGKDILGYFFEDSDGDDNSDEDGGGCGCICCDCKRQVMSEMYFPCRHGCCCTCKIRVLRNCPYCDAIIKTKFPVFT